MSPIIAALSLGPVGAFIAGGRRSRDLWYGSRFLSEATRWAAHSLALNPEVALIVPLRERIETSFLKKERGPTISNKILCRIDAPVARVRVLLAEARTAAHRFLADEVRRHQDRLSGVAEPRQIKSQADAIEEGDFIEFYAAWAPLAERSQQAEEQAILRALTLLDGCKAARLFPAPYSEAGRPKCSLDAGWDSVLREPDPGNKDQARELLHARTDLGIRPDERLCAVGLARRLAAFAYTVEGSIGLPRLPFPSLWQVAADSWLEAARRDARLRREVERVNARFRRLFDDHRDAGRRNACFVLSSPARRPGAPPDREPDFDASIYFENQIETRRRELQRWCRQAGVAQDTLREHFALLAELEGPVRALQESRLLGLPVPYFVLLEADGDGVGDALKHAQGTDRDRLVRALYTFADEAWKIIDDQRGCAFYVGGDELAAYLPLDTAHDAAGALDRLYNEVVRPHAPRTSLSVGLVVAHVMDDLRATRARAGSALKQAKQRRRGTTDRPGFLVVQEEPRGGGGRGFGGPTAELVPRIETGMKLLREEKVSVRSAHDLFELYHFLHSEREPASTRGIHLGQAILPQKQRRAGRNAEGDDLRRLLGQVENWRDLLDVAGLLLHCARVHEVAALRPGGTP